MQQSTEPPNRTETERHWDQICLGLTAAGTAVMAGVFLISGIAEERPDPLRLITAARYAGGAFMTILFAFMAVSVHRTIFLRERAEAAECHRRKEDGARGVMEMLGTMIFCLALWTTALVFIPPHIPLIDDGSREIIVSQHHWDRLEALTGTDEKANDQLGWLLDIAEETCTGNLAKRHIRNPICAFPME